jgi:hypothetical protein
MIDKGYIIPERLYWRLYQYNIKIRRIIKRKDKSLWIIRKFIIFQTLIIVSII